MRVVFIHSKLPLFTQTFYTQLPFSFYAVFFFFTEVVLPNISSDEDGDFMPIKKRRLIALAVDTLD